MLTLAVALFIGCTILFGLATLVWLGKLLAEIANALVFGVIGGFKLTVAILFWFAHKMARLARWLMRRAAPLIGRVLEDICVYVGIALIWLWFHFRRLYVRRELKARKDATK
jgi:hypothetical protein